MENYVLFSGKIKGKYRDIQIYPMMHLAKHYLIHWDGFEIGVIKKANDQWQTDNDQLSHVVDELGAFIDRTEAEEGNKLTF